MNILWFTGRTFGNFCSTTQSALADGLIKKGHSLHIINPDIQGTHDEKEWEHTGFSLSSIPGLQSIKLSLDMKKWLKKFHTKPDTVAIVDWRVLSRLHKTLESQEIPWIMMDRSPPADPGILSLLQWPAWKRSWQKVSLSPKAKGCTVSSGHQNLIKSKLKISQEKFLTLPAGVDLELFKPTKKTQTLTLVYHGRLDKHRGVLALPMLVSKSIDQGVDLKLHLIGEGDCLKQLQSLAEEHKFLEVSDNMIQTEVAQVLSRAHIGLLPMPDTKLWSIASPLKRSEYAASGMLIYGIEHDGHRFHKQHNLSWLKLVKQHDFHTEGINWMKNLTLEQLQSNSLKAREFAEKNLSWYKPINDLENALLTQLN